MKNTKIYRILSGSERTHLNRFLKYVRSPYLNSSDQVRRLAEFVLVEHKDKELHTEKEIIWAETLGIMKPYNDTKYRKLCNDLLDNYEHFLIHEKLKSTKMLQSNLLLESIKENDHKELVDKHINKSNRILDREIDRSADYYLQKYFFGRNLQSLKTSYERKLDKNKSESLSEYDKLSGSLDAFYVIEKLRHGIELLTWAKLYKTEIAIPDLNDTFDLIEKENLMQIPAVKIYRYMYSLVSKEDNEMEYLLLRDLAQTEITNFPLIEQRGIIDVLLSHAIKGGNKGDKEALAEMLSIYEWGIETEIIFEKGHLSPTTFRNYILGGLRLGEIDKVENFIAEKSSLIEESRRENAVEFNKARVAFHKKNYSKVIEQLAKVNYDEIWYNLNSKNYLLASYYELEEWDTLSFQISSFQQFLRREKSIREGYRKMHLNYASFLGKIVSKQHDKASLVKLVQVIKEEKLVFNRKWLLDKVEELL